ncbi:MAG: 2-hydroxymuconic semialdehyde dehydrogenase [Flammeovirgaceae bacterium]|nr:2-hydroxymuconic semialdehyde dehydrogenase [Flammeovirgaceae bacterium]MBR06315.1 2-hydroxymuconic semialdehyde dehydrogenase [Rickettsiales bacterium]HCX24854.1 2-hydroxymuconic semialdehyde dehydrogenase [Cytophagales bacterium]|tara:strand:- start:1600 stop:3024 length:1425 start_codon:yes stop_codon:yes gene_type:complete
MIILENFINGERIAPLEGQYLDNYNPTTGEVFSQLPDSSEADLEMTVDAAQRAFPSWSLLPIDERSRYLLKISDLIESNLDRLAEAESLDNGKPVSLARSVDIPRAAANFRFFASAIVNESTQAHVMEGVAVNYTRRAPLGVVGCISPWNLPLYLLTWKIAPALATGNCVIAKPSEITPYTAYLLSELIQEADLPPGVLNIIHGTGSNIGQKLVEHHKVKAISFTGGTATGRKIGITAAQQFKKVSLELGGKNPVLVFADCDFDEAVKTSVRSAFTNQGEICLCGSRIFVEHSIYDQFKKEFVAQVKQLTVGNPTEDVNLGPLVSEQHLSKVASYVKIAREEGGNVLTGGAKLDGSGYFFEPTVIDGLSELCTINQEEVFGPVVTLVSFNDEEDAIQKANSTVYGLAAVIWTKDIQKAHRVAHQVEGGIVWVNCWMLRDLRTPFGGMKESGVGREGGSEALRFFTEPQNICVKL